MCLKGDTVIELELKKYIKKNPSGKNFKYNIQLINLALQFRILTI